MKTIKTCKMIFRANIAALLLSTYAFAAPSVSTINGSLIHGQVVTVSGSGFGTKSPVAPLLWDPVDGMYSNTANGAAVPTGSGYPWDSPGGSDMYNPTFTTSNARGKLIAKYTNKNSPSSVKNAVLGGRSWAACSGKKMYMSYWMYPHQDPGNPGNSNKLFRITDNGGWSGSVATVIADPGSGNIFTYSIASGYTGIQYPSTFGSTGAWNRLEVSIDNSVSPKPSVVFQVNNTTRASWNSSSSILNLTGIYTIGADWTNAQNNPIPQLDWGEIYVDSTLARVEVCNSSTKISSNHCEIQIPTTQWVDGTLQIKINQGSFADGSTAYLYVMDASGNVSTTNSASTITFGSSGGGSSDTAAPTNVILTAPLSGATLSGSTTVTATAYDNVGVAKVEFYVDSPSSSAVATDTTSPYTFTWNTSSVSNGSHTLYAKATDAAGNSTISTGITVTVSNTVLDSTAPTVSISSPTASAIIAVNTVVTATATDNVGVTSVDFYLDSTSSTPIASDTAAPFTFTWDPSTVTNGSHTLYAKASDAAGNTKIASVAVTVQVSTPPPSSGAISRNECVNAPSGTIFCEDFEGASPKSNFNDYDGNPSTENQIVTDSGPAADSSNKAIRLRVPAGQAGVSDLVKVLPSSYDKLYARWYFKYEPGFNFAAPNHGGGLWAGDRGYVGQSGNRPTGADFAGFNVQYNSSTANPYPLAPYSYAYYRGMYQDCSNPSGSCYGDSLPCVYDSGSGYCTKAADRPTVTMPNLVAGQWYCYEQMVDMGTASTSGTGATGRLTQWLDGNQIGDNTNLWLRTTSSLKLQNLWLSLYHHDGTHSTVGELIDNVVVSTQRIGCGGTGVVTPVNNLKAIQVIP